jgi:hypothetical protein
VEDITLAFHDNAGILQNFRLGSHDLDGATWTLATAMLEMADAGQRRLLAMVCLWLLVHE